MIQKGEKNGKKPHGFYSQNAQHVGDGWLSSLSIPDSFHKKEPTHDKNEPTRQTELNG